MSANVLERREVGGTMARLQEIENNIKKTVKNLDEIEIQDLSIAKAEAAVLTLQSIASEMVRLYDQISPNEKKNPISPEAAKLHGLFHFLTVAYGLNAAVQDVKSDILNKLYVDFSTKTPAKLGEEVGDVFGNFKQRITTINKGVAKLAAMLKQAKPTFEEFSALPQSEQLLFELGRHTFKTAGNDTALDAKEEHVEKELEADDELDEIRKKIDGTIKELKEMKPEQLSVELMEDTIRESLQPIARRIVELHTQFANSGSEEVTFDVARLYELFGYLNGLYDELGIFNIKAPQQIIGLATKYSKSSPERIRREITSAFQKLLDSTLSNSLIALQNAEASSKGLKMADFKDLSKTHSKLFELGAPLAGAAAVTQISSNSSSASSSSSSSNSGGSSSRRRSGDTDDDNQFSPLDAREEDTGLKPSHMRTKEQEEQLLAASLALTRELSAQKPNPALVAKAPAQQASVSAAAAPASSSQKEEPKTGGFFSSLFGGDKEKPATPVMPTAAVSVAPAALPTPKKPAGAVSAMPGMQMGGQSPALLRPTSVKKPLGEKPAEPQDELAKAFAAKAAKQASDAQVASKLGVLPAPKPGAAGSANQSVIAGGQPEQEQGSDNALKKA